MLWKGRFKKKMSPAMETLNRSLDVDIRLFPYEIAIDRAYSFELARIGILSRAEHGRILSSLERMMKEFAAGRYRRLPGDEDVHSLVERRLHELAGRAGHKIHTGRSRNEMVITEAKMLLRDELAKIKKRSLDLVGSIVRLSKKSLDAVMPGYTHLQQAQPVLFSHYLNSLAFSLCEDVGRIDRLVGAGLAELPLGSGAIAGTAFPVDRKRLAKKLGFKRISSNSMTAVSQRDELLEAASIVSILMIHLSRYAEDLIVWSTREFGFVELCESVSTGSSMMPQKKNPDSLELVRGKSAMVIGRMTSLFVLMKGLPLTYARDMQEDKAPIFAALDDVSSCLNVFKDVIETLQVKRKKMLASMAGGLFATDLADYLAKKGMPFRECHFVVARIVRDSIGQGRNLRDISLKELKKYSGLFEKDALLCFDPLGSLNARSCRGGTALISVKRQIQELSKFINHA